MNWRTILQKLLPFIAAILAAIGTGNDENAAKYGPGVRAANAGVTGSLALAAAIGAAVLGGGAAGVAKGAARRRRVNELLTELQDHTAGAEMPQEDIANLFKSNMMRGDV